MILKIQKILTSLFKIKNLTLNKMDKERETFKKGDICKIIRLENSHNNIFKGYHAEIKEYKLYTDYCLVYIPATNNMTKIKIHKDHLISLN